MRRIKLVLALAAAMVVLMMAAAPAMATTLNLGNHNHDFDNNGGNISFANFGGGLFLFDANRGLGNGGDIDINGVNGLGFDNVDFD